MTDHQRVHVIATQHLDVAWLWARVPQGEDLMRQCFERAIEMIEADPGARFVFSRSTAWSFWIVQQRYPALFEQVRCYVAEGKIELCGGQWVEPDHYIPDGEALVRQIALGQWYYQATFGKLANVCWVPDIFGHPATLPQIMLKAGLDGYYFHRARPRDQQGRPLHQFIWQGPDGSRIYALSGQWVGRPDNNVFQAAAAELSQSGLPATHVVCGLRSDRRITMQVDWVGLPAQAAADDCRWSTAGDVLDDMRSYAGRLPVLAGEFGPQYTGTYTSNGHNKRTNRRLETLLLNAEKAAAWAALYGQRYPAEQLTQAWRDLCVNQFHDICCGCSVAVVHAEDRQLFDEVERRAQWVLDQALALIVTAIGKGLPAGAAPPLAVFDFVAWPRTVPVVLPAELVGPMAVRRDDGVLLPAQPVQSGDGEPAGLLILHDSPGIACGLYQIEAGPAQPPPHAVSVEGLSLENDFLRAEIDGASGEIVRLFDKRVGLECLPPGGTANRLVLLPDRTDLDPQPIHSWEPWLIRYTGAPVAVGSVTMIQVVEAGPLRAAIRVERRAQLAAGQPETVIVQEIILYGHEPILRFEMQGVWHAAQAMLRAVFDLPFTCRSVAAEAPYGVAERGPQADITGQRDVDSTAEDRRAPGDVPPEPDRAMQKWLDVSDGQRGMLYLNNGKYGYDAGARQVGLSLLRAPAMQPGQIIGLGPFEFAYAVMPHAGDWRSADAARHGHEFNNVPVVVPVGSGVNDGVGCQWWDLVPALPAGIARQFAQVVSEGALLTVVKQAEAGDGLVVRLYETLGRRTSARVAFCREVTWAAECDLLERVPGAGPCAIEPGAAPEWDGCQVSVSLRPYEIKSLRIALARS